MSDIKKGSHYICKKYMFGFKKGTYYKVLTTYASWVYVCDLNNDSLFSCISFTDGVTKHTGVLANNFHDYFEDIKEQRRMKLKRLETNNE